MPDTRTATNNTNLEPRVTALEVNLKVISDDIKDLASSVRQQGDNVNQALLMQAANLTNAITSAKDTFDQQIVKISDKIGESGRPQWANIIAFVGLIVLMVGGVLYPINRELNRHEDAIMEIEHSWREQAYTNGVMEERTSTLKEGHKTIQKTP